MPVGHLVKNVNKTEYMSDEKVNITFEIRDDILSEWISSKLKIICDKRILCEMGILALGFRKNC